MSEIKGYFDKNGKWNAVKKVNGEYYRERVEVICLDNGKFYGLKTFYGYRLPAGSLSNKATLEDQARNELLEEAFLVAGKEMIYVCDRRVDYIFENEAHVENFKEICIPGIKLKGMLNHIYVCEYDGYYNEKPTQVEESELDIEMYEDGRWYPIEELKTIFSDNELEKIANVSL